MKELIIEITNRCMNNCIHCSSYDSCSHKHIDLSIDHIKQILNIPALSNYDQIVFSGGEPVLHPDFTEIVHYVASLNLPIKIYSSGVYNNEVYTSNKYQKAFSKIDTVTLSIYSAHEHVHQAITQNSESYNKTLKAIDLIQKSNCSIEVNNVPMKINSADIVSVYHKFKHIFAKYNVLKLVKQGRAIFHWEAISPNSQELSSTLKELHTLDNVKVGNSFGIFSNAPYTCEAGKSKLCVTYDGYIIPCEVFKFQRDSFRNISDYINDYALLDADILNYSQHAYVRGCQSHTIQLS